MEDPKQEDLREDGPRPRVPETALASRRMIAADLSLIGDIGRGAEDHASFHVCQAIGHLADMLLAIEENR